MPVLGDSIFKLAPLARGFVIPRPLDCELVFCKNGLVFRLAALGIRGLTVGLLGWLSELELWGPELLSDLNGDLLASSWTLEPNLAYDCI